MKRSIFLMAMMFVLASAIYAQNDTLYIMKNGVVAAKYNAKNQVDSIIFYKPDPLPANVFVDTRDGNLYHTVTIGNQIWMAENLRYLPNVSGSSKGSIFDFYYYVYGYEGTNVDEAKATANYQTYGVLYNWTAAANSCPAGWHLPSDAEWTQLINYLGGENVAGGKLKEAGIVHWTTPNTGATNETGFTALPGGRRMDKVGFSGIGTDVDFWTSTNGELVSSVSRMRNLSYNHVSVYAHSSGNDEGLYVRCVKD